jgi:hypothetical protein
MKKETADIVAERANFRCEYCHSQERFSPDPFSLDHIFPRSKGGKSSIDNLAYACQGCNSYKYNHTIGIDPVTGQEVQLFNPRAQEWEAHFTWSEDWATLLGLTPVGRATVFRLRLNRPGVQGLRKVLASIGLHPPPK